MNHLPKNNDTSRRSATSDAVSRLEQGLAPSDFLTGYANSQQPDTADTNGARRKRRCKKAPCTPSHDVADELSSDLSDTDSGSSDSSDTESHSEAEQSRQNEKKSDCAAWSIGIFITLVVLGIGAFCALYFGGFWDDDETKMKVTVVFGGKEKQRESQKSDTLQVVLAWAVEQDFGGNVGTVEASSKKEFGFLKNGNSSDFYSQKELAQTLEELGLQEGTKLTLTKRGSPSPAPIPAPAPVPVPAPPTTMKLTVVFQETGKEMSRDFQRSDKLQMVLTWAQREFGGNVGTVEAGAEFGFIKNEDASSFYSSEQLAQSLDHLGLENGSKLTLKRTRWELPKPAVENGWVNRLVDQQQKFVVEQQLGPDGEVSKVTLNGSNVTMFSVQASDSLPYVDDAGKRHKGTQGADRTRQNTVEFSEIVLVGDVSKWMQDKAIDDDEDVDWIFQAASQFNALEMMDPTVTPEGGVSGYVDDKTQGPAVAVAGGYATLFRNYFMDPTPDVNTVVVPGKTADSRGQLTTQYNGLKKVMEVLDTSEYNVGRGGAMSNGYFLPTEPALQKLSSDSLNEASAISNAIKDMTVVFHPAVSLTSTEYGKKPSPREHHYGDHQHVGQVFASACPIQYSGLPAELWNDFAKKELQQAYLLTMLSAAHANRKKWDFPINIVLTLVGGGVFGNSPELVAGAINGAIAEFKQRKDGLNIKLHFNFFKFSDEQTNNILDDINTVLKMIESASNLTGSWTPHHMIKHTEIDNTSD